MNCYVTSPAGQTMIVDESARADLAARLAQGWTLGPRTTLPVTPARAPAPTAPKATAPKQLPKPVESRADVIAQAQRLVARAQRVIADHEREAGALPSGLSNASGRGAELDRIMGTAHARPVASCHVDRSGALVFAPPTKPAAVASPGAADRARLEAQARMDRQMGLRGERRTVIYPGGRTAIGVELTPAQAALLVLDGAQVRA